MPHKTDTKASQCDNCNRWELKEGDSFCAFCGFSLLGLSLHPKKAALVAGVRHSKDLVVSNASSEAFRLRLRKADRPIPGVRFDPVEFEVAPQSRKLIKLELNPEQLPEQFSEKSVSYEFELLDGPPVLLPLLVKVIGRPWPHLVSTTLQFGELRAGEVQTRSLVLCNRGGMPTRLLSIVPEGSSQLQVAPSTRLPLELLPGAKETVDITWDTTLTDEVRSPPRSGVKLRFEHSDREYYADAQATKVEFKLLVKGDLFSENGDIAVLDSVLSGHNQVIPATLTNRSTYDVVISDIAGDADWIEVVSSPQTLQLGRGESHKFEIVCHPSGLEAGLNVGHIHIRAEQHETKQTEIRLNVLHPEPYYEYIGIDFGTTNSVVAHWSPEDSEITLVPDPFTGAALMPSILVFGSGPSSFLFGERANREAAAYPEKTVRSIKRAIGQGTSHEFLGRSFSPEALASLIIGRLVELAELSLYSSSNKYLSVARAIITVPANFFDQQIRGVLRACERAGLDIEEEEAARAAEVARERTGAEVHAGVIIDEPSAAALYYLSQLEKNQSASELYAKIASPEGLHLLIYDHGGGTLDVSLAHAKRLANGKTGVTVLANTGNNRVGGESFDLVLMKRLLAICKRRTRTFDDQLIFANLSEVEARRTTEGWSDDDWSEVLTARYDWKNAAEKVKKILSEHADAEFRVSSLAVRWFENGLLMEADEDFNVDVTRKQLESACEPLLADSEAVIRQALQIANVEPNTVDYVLHTGQQSLMPAVFERLRRVFENLPESHNILDRKHLKVCVAKGAALYGYLKSTGTVAGSGGIEFLNEGQRLPYSYGVDRTTGIARAVFEPVLEKGDVYPTEKTKVYAEADVPPDGWHTVRVYENAGTSIDIEGNPAIRRLGVLRTDSMADGKPGCVVVFRIDANRKLQVFVDSEEVPIEPEPSEEEDGWHW